MDEDRVLVPPEVYEELDPLYQAGDLDPDDRDGATRAASDRGYDKAVKWLEQVDETVYERAARGEFETQSD